MAKTDAPETVKAAPQPEKKKKEKAKKVKPVKPKLEVPPLVELTITFSRMAFLMVSILAALLSFSAGADLQTIFVRTMVTMIVAGMAFWLVSWWVAQQMIEDRQAELKAKEAEKEAQKLPEEGLLTDVKA